MENVETMQKELTFTIHSKTPHKSKPFYSNKSHLIDFVLPETAFSSDHLRFSSFFFLSPSPCFHYSPFIFTPSSFPHALFLFYFLPLLFLSPSPFSIISLFFSSRPLPIPFPSSFVPPRPRPPPPPSLSFLSENLIINSFSSNGGFTPRQYPTYQHPWALKVFIMSIQLAAFLKLNSPTWRPLSWRT